MRNEVEGVEEGKKEKEKKEREEKTVEAIWVEVMKCNSLLYLQKAAKIIKVMT